MNDVSEQSCARQALDRYNSGFFLTLPEIDRLLLALNTTPLRDDAPLSTFPALLKLRAARLLERLNAAEKFSEGFGAITLEDRDFLLWAFVEDWLDEDADLSRIREPFDAKVSALLARMKADEELQGDEMAFLVVAKLRNKLSDEDAVFIDDRVKNGEGHRGKLTTPSYPQTDHKSVLPLNFSIERFEVYIGYIKDGENFKEASVYRNGEHQISVKVLIKLDETDAQGNPVKVNVDHLINSLYLCRYGNGAALPLDAPDAGGAFYRKKMNRFAYLLDPKRQEIASASSSERRHALLPDGTIVVELYVSVKGDINPDELQIAAGLYTVKGPITTGEHSTDTIMANGSNWSGQSRVSVKTLEPIDYSKVDNIRLEDKHHMQIHMWKNWDDLDNIYNELYTSVASIACKADHAGWSYKGDLAIRPAKDEFKFKIKVPQREDTGSHRREVTYVDNTSADLVYWEGGDSAKTAFIFVDRPAGGIRWGRIIYHWGVCKYSFWFNNVGFNYNEFEADHRFENNVDDGKIHVNGLFFWLGKSSLWAEEDYWSRPRTTTVRVYDNCGNSGDVSISAKSSEWPSLRINGEIL